MKYSEKEILDEISEYISNTYRGHYSSGGVQTLDLIDLLEMPKHSVEVTY